VYIANLFAHALENGRIKTEQAQLLVTQAMVRLDLNAENLDALAREIQPLYDRAILLVS